MYIYVYNHVLSQMLQPGIAFPLMIAPGPWPTTISTVPEISRCVDIRRPQLASPPPLHAMFEEAKESKIAKIAQIAINKPNLPIFASITYPLHLNIP